MSKSFKEISEEVIQFCEKRNWQNANPNALISAILIELGELAENYQWDKEFKEWDSDKKEEVGFEFVDVLFYLIRLADKSGIDIEEYFYKKLPKLEKKFPIGSNSLEQNKKYRDLGKNKHYE